MGCIYSSQLDASSKQIFFMFSTSERLLTKAVLPVGASGTPSYSRLVWEFPSVPVNQLGAATALLRISTQKSVGSRNLLLRLIEWTPTGVSTVFPSRVGLWLRANGCPLLPLVAIQGSIYSFLLTLFPVPPLLVVALFPYLWHLDFLEIVYSPLMVTNLPQFARDLLGVSPKVPHSGNPLSSRPNGDGQLLSQVKWRPPQGGPFCLITLRAKRKKDDSIIKISVYGKEVQPSSFYVLLSHLNSHGFFSNTAILMVRLIEYFEGGSFWKGCPNVGGLKNANNQIVTNF